MNIDLFLAPSLNGFIAHFDGSEEFISEETWNIHAKSIESHGALIVGRKTVNVVDSWNDPKYSLDEVKTDHRIVVTRDKSYSRPGWEVAHSPAEAVKILESKGQSTAHLIGGATLAASFLNEKLVSKVHLLYQPWLVNDGVPMFTELGSDVKLKITSSRQLESGELLVEASII